MYKRPFLVVGEGIVGPLMALALRQQGLKAHLLQNDSVPSSVDQGSIVLAPDMTDYLTEDLGLSSARPSGSQLKNHYTYDNRGNVLMNLNLDSLKPEESGTFFSCQRSLIEGLLLKECGKGSAYLEYKNPVKVMRAAKISSTSSAADGGITAHFDSGSTVDYQAVINVSRDMSVVPLSTTHELSVKNREAMVKDYKRAVDVARLYFEWTFPIPREDWDLTSDELAEIIHRQGRRMWVSATSARNLTVTTTMPSHLRVSGTTPSGHCKGLQTYWGTGEPNTHTLWVDALQPAMQKAIAKEGYKRVDYLTPSYCHEHWLEDGGKVIRVGPAAHGATAQPIDIADAIDFEDCFVLAEFLATNSDSNDLKEFLNQRRKEVIDELNSVAALDELTLRKRGSAMFMLRRTVAAWTKAFSRNWKRALRPFCYRGAADA